MQFVYSVLPYFIEIELIETEFIKVKFIKVKFVKLYEIEAGLGQVRLGQARLGQVGQVKLGQMFHLEVHQIYEAIWCLSHLFCKEFDFLEFLSLRYSIFSAIDNKGHSIKLSSMNSDSINLNSTIWGSTCVQLWVPNFLVKFHLNLVSYDNFFCRTK